MVGQPIRRAKRHNATHRIAEILGTVTAKVQRAIELGHRSRIIDANDLIEVLLAVADELDPPIRPPRGQKTRPGH